MASYNITSNDCSFGCPIIYTNTNQQCYFVHRQLNNAWHNNAHSVILRLCFAIIASNVGHLWVEDSLLVLKEILILQPTQPLTYEYIQMTYEWYRYKSSCTDLLSEKGPHNQIFSKLSSMWIYWNQETLPQTVTNISNLASFFSNTSISTTTCTSSCSIRRIYNDLSDLKPETDKAVVLPYLTWNHKLGHKAVWFPLADLKSQTRSQSCSNRFYMKLETRSQICFEDCIWVKKDLLCSSIVLIKCVEYCRGGFKFFQGGANPKVEGGDGNLLFG